MKQRSPTNPNPRTISVEYRVMKFFEAAPDETLSLSDIAVKFGVHYETGRKAVTSLKAAGRITDQQIVRSEYGSAAW